MFLRERPTAIVITTLYAAAAATAVAWCVLAIAMFVLSGALSHSVCVLVMPVAMASIALGVLAGGLAAGVLLRSGPWLALVFSGATPVAATACLWTEFWRPELAHHGLAIGLIVSLGPLGAVAGRLAARWLFRRFYPTDRLAGPGDQRT